jgi:hypothetical protein
LWFLLLAKASNQPRISAIGFVALQLTLTESFDASRINDTDNVSGLVEVQRQGLAVVSSGFEASVQFNDSMLCEPLVELDEASCIVVELLIAELGIALQSNVKGTLSDVNAQNIHHRSPW